MGVRLPIYLDHQATTPVDARVRAAMLPFLGGIGEKFGNAASQHSFGWVAEAAVDRAREQVARLINASPSEIIFTSGATEANNLALLGVARAYGLPRHERALLSGGATGSLSPRLTAIQDPASRGDRFVSVATEHKAILDPLTHLVEEGFDAEILGVAPTGLVDPRAFAAALTPRTLLASVMAANNEIGVLQPIAALGALARERGVLFHTDASQAAGKIPLDVQAMPIDLLSISGHKLYGPKGVGALFVRRKGPRVTLAPIMFGGGHERGLRSGTLDVAGIVGLGEACAVAAEEMASEATRLLDLRDRLLAGVMARLTHVVVNGDLTQRLPGNLSLAFLHVEGEALINAMKDVALSSGSACTSASREPSHVLAALGTGLAHHSIRFGLGRTTTAEEIDFVIEALAQKVPLLRASSASWEEASRGPAPRWFP